MSKFSADLLVRQGRLIDPANGTDALGDILIRQGKIVESRPNLPTPPDVPILMATGLVVAPGFIDIHTHLREPGYEHKETIQSGTAAAAAGGICAVAAMPNTNPPPDSSDHLQLALERAQTANVRYYPIACVTVARRGSGSLAPLEELAKLGAVAFSDDGDPVEDEALMRRALEIARDLDRPIFPHEEVKSLTTGGCMHAGEVNARLGVKGMPAAGEEEMVARDIELVRQTGGPLHIAHISTAGTAQLVRRAKADGLPVTCEVLPHHFVLTDCEVEHQGTAAKMSPPLREAADVDAMLTGLADGTIEVIATDHAPHTAAEKAQSLTQAPMGIVGLETAVGLTLTYLVDRVLSLQEAIARWTCHPARILRLPGGALTQGMPGDLTLLDLTREWEVVPAHFRSKSRNTPFAGYHLKGKAVATIVGGQIVYSELAA
ncbi:MAG: dihydroorotase [Gemmatimonadetes bacterium]|nr:dihydroorotase [Gemmatimonadota bacterium]MXY83266.1 dihydroorotase [Gemmatimonadota bacterium]MYB67716.1 dihydroorotase [Gemmatimonadota bacterium]